MTEIGSTVTYSKILQLESWNFRALVFGTHKLGDSRSLIRSNLCGGGVVCGVVVNLYSAKLLYSFTKCSIRLVCAFRWSQLLVVFMHLWQAIP